ARMREKEVARARAASPPPAAAPSAPRPAPQASAPPRPHTSAPPASRPFTPQRGPRPRGAKKKRRGVDDKLVAENVKRTLASMDAGGRHRARRTRERED